MDPALCQHLLKELPGCSAVATGDFAAESIELIDWVRLIGAAPAVEL